MAAPKGNKNAEKWTVKESQDFINEVYKYVLDHKDCCSIEEACCELGWYEKILHYLQTKFNDNEKIDFNPIKKASGILKERIIKQGLNNKYNPTMAIFILKNNHDMKDKTEREIINPKLEITVLDKKTEKGLEQLENKLSADD